MHRSISFGGTAPVRFTVHLKPDASAKAKQATRKALSAVYEKDMDVTFEP